MDRWKLTSLVLTYDFNNISRKDLSNVKKSPRLLDLPTELLVNIFELIVQEDLETILSVLNDTPDKDDRLFQIVNEIAYTSIIITNYSKLQFYVSEELRRIVPTYKLDRSIFWSLGDILNDEVRMPPSRSCYVPKRVYYIFGNDSPVESIHKVMRQFCKYLNNIPHEFKRITSEVCLLLNPSTSFDTVEEFKRNFQDLNVTFLNHVILLSTSFSDLRRLFLNDGIYYSFLNQKLELVNITRLSYLQELYLNNLNLLSVENLRLPSSILSLNLSNNNIVNIYDLKVPNSLKKLDLSHNNIAFIMRSFFPDSLEELNLGYNRLNLLSGCIFPDSVRYLDLSNNFIEDINFSFPSELEYMNLQSCPIKNVGVDTLTTIINSDMNIDL